MLVTVDQQKLFLFTDVVPVQLIFMDVVGGSPGAFCLCHVFVLKIVFPIEFNKINLQQSLCLLILSKMRNSKIDGNQQNGNNFTVADGSSDKPPTEQQAQTKGFFYRPRKTLI